ncbi:hypothetical protein D9M71_768400 [compost metagenome]
MQGLDCLLTPGERQHLCRHAQAPGNQAEVVGTDPLVAIAVDGDVDRLVIGKGNTDPQGSLRAQPLLLRRGQLHRLKVGEGRHQGKGQALCSMDPTAHA